MGIKIKIGDHSDEALEQKEEQVLEESDTKEKQDEDLLKQAIQAIQAGDSEGAIGLIQQVIGDEETEEKEQEELLAEHQGEAGPASPASSFRADMGKVIKGM